MSENTISVTQFSQYIRQIFCSEELLHNISIYGEISGLSISRGTAYFNLKDDNSLLQCVRFNIDELGLSLKDGDMVVVCGSPNYYIKGGKFSFVVSTIEPYGLGLLFQRFLELKNKLEAEGLFDISRKKPQPKFINRVGVVTSASGAVIQDIINVTKRRNPLIDIVLYPVKVQGIGAEFSICQGIKELNQTNVDVIIVARGGGSLEDLSAFNTEMVARAVADSSKMIISAVGHETDFTICDFVSDLRAPTPSAAAEIVSKDLDVLLTRLNNASKKVCNYAKEFVNRKEREIMEKLYDIKSIYSTFTQEQFSKFREINIRLCHLSKNLFTEKFQKLEMILNKIKLKNPIEILQMGYAFLEYGDKKIVSTQEVKVGQVITTKLKDGSITSKIESIKEKK